MTERLLRRSFFVLLAVSVTAGLFFLSAPLPAEPKLDTQQDPLVTKMVCEFLRRGHLNKPEIGDELSRRLFRRFLKELDPAKLYFVKSDLDEFKEDETNLDDQLLKGDVGFAYKVYNRLVKRMEQRQKLIEELVGASHDYTVKEYLDTDYDKMEPAADDAQVRERWRKRIKFDLLQQRVGQKPVPEAEAKEKVLTRYRSVLKRYKQMDNSDLLELYLYHLTTSVDPHSTYMSPNTLDDFSIAMRLNLDGIGAVLRSENGQTIVEEVVPGGAAATDGHLKAGDKIVAVAQGDGKYTDVVDMKLREVVKLIRGKRGTKVQLKVVSAAKLDPATIDLTRQKIELKSQEARGDVVEQGKKADGTPYRVGVIDLPSFYAGGDEGKDNAKSATADVRKILKDMSGKHIDGLVLDLRRNGGGALSEALSLTGLFIDQGPVVQVKGSAGKVLQKNDPEKGTDYDGPMIVLISRFSASASEILAGALQDYGRALIVGDPTHGKGTVQAVIDLGDRLNVDPPPKLGALKLTIQQFYRVNGDSTQNRGVVPDVALPSLAEQLGTAEKDLDFALKFDHVQPAEHERLNLVPDEVKEALKDRSARRVKDSADFQKLAKEIELFKERKDRKKVPLAEKELRDELARDEADKLDKKAEELLPTDTPKSDAAYKFQHNFMNDEILQIMEDFIQGKKLVKGR